MCLLRRACTFSAGFLTGAALLGPAGLRAPAAQAEIPSLDAYGGEALVLGRPHHGGKDNGGARHGGSSSEGSTTGRGSGKEGASVAAGIGHSAVTGRGPFNGSERSTGDRVGASHAGAAASAGAGSPQNGNRRVGASAGETGGKAASLSTKESGTGAPTSHLGGGSDAPRRTSVVNAYPTAAAESGGAEALSALDVVLIAAGLLCIAGVGAALRGARETG